MLFAPQIKKPITEIVEDLMKVNNLDEITACLSIEHYGISVTAGLTKVYFETFMKTKALEKAEAELAFIRASK